MQNRGLAGCRRNAIQFLLPTKRLIRRVAHGVCLAGKIVVVLAGLPDGFEVIQNALEVVAVIAGQFVDARGFKLVHARIKGAEAA